jgi:BA14K-like protein
MAFLFYLVIVVVSVFGVLLEMDVLVQPGRSIERTTLALPQTMPNAKVAGKPELMPVKPAVALRPKPAPATKTAMANPAAAIVGDKPLGPPQTLKPAVSNLCDIDACSRAYRTFDPADCTFAIRVGERILCTRGTPPQQAAAPPANDRAKEPPKVETANANPADQVNPPAAPTTTTGDAAPAVEARVDSGPLQALKPLVSNRCDIEICSRAYRTFDPADCTFAIRVGERTLCTRGAPPQQVAAAPAAAPGDIMKEEAKPEAANPPDQGNGQPAATTTKTADILPTAADTQADTGAPQTLKTLVSNRCDIAACKDAYRSFDPADCTYVPRFGVRDLCTKGTPPQQQVAAAPAAVPGDIMKEEPKPEAANTKPADTTTKTADVQPTATDTPADTGAPQTLKTLVSNRCDLAACKDAYHSFDPVDCTYMPRFGVRELCTKGTPPQATTVAAANPADQAAAKPPDGNIKTADATPAADVQSELATPQRLKPLVSNLCDIATCSRAYRTFNPADCTFALRVGDRRLCTRGTPPVAAEASAAKTADTVANPSCNVQACAAAYPSFNPQDCTYQPGEGPRRLCDRQ